MSFEPENVVDAGRNAPSERCRPLRTFERSRSSRPMNNDALNGDEANDDVDDSAAAAATDGQHFRLSREVWWR